MSLHRKNSPGNIPHISTYNFRTPRSSADPGVTAINRHLWIPSSLLLAESPSEYFIRFPPSSLSGSSHINDIATLEFNHQNVRCVPSPPFHPSSPSTCQIEHRIYLIFTHLYSFVHFFFTFMENLFLITRYHNLVACCVLVFVFRSKKFDYLYYQKKMLFFGEFCSDLL